MTTMNDRPAGEHGHLAGYYRLHSKIYDVTRWSFLHGRRALVQRLSEQGHPNRILEVGCGTGTNLLQLARAFPEAELHGLDLSGHMLDRARRKLESFGPRIHFHHQAYSDPIHTDRPFETVLFSYSLSMFNPGWQRALDAARDDLTTCGLVAVVDFHDTRFGAFSRWMKMNHVRMDGHLREGLRERFEPRVDEAARAWLGTWRYFTFIGASKCAGSNLHEAPND
jgi:S-adenosylmethionine-diacylgycerolhomoserine-N-methlytransferase